MGSVKSQSGRQRGQATRKDIIGVARRLFSEHGYHNTGIADIQQATGLTKGAFYHHFRSKEELALAILDVAQADYAKHLIGPAMARSSPGDRLEALLDGAVELNSRPEWCNCQMMVTLCAELTASNGRLREAVQEMQLGLFEVWRSQIAEARDAGQLDESIDPETAAQWVMSTMAGLLLARKLGTARVAPEAIIQMMKHALLSKPGEADKSGGTLKQ